MNPASNRILVTGAAGYIGQQVCRALAQKHFVLATDIRAADTGTLFAIVDIRDPALSKLMQEHRITHVVHLAAVLGDSNNPERDYDIDVNGTSNVLQACVQSGVSHFTITSSGAAYGYYADNPARIRETDALRGNDSYPYSRHKRLVEEMLADYRNRHPQLQQLILRPGAVLGAGTRNLITNLFEKKRILKIRGADSPFTFIWDQDVVTIIEQGVSNQVTGAFNLAGDGTLTLRDIAHELGKPCLELPAGFLKAALAIGQTLRLTRYGPEQLDFLRYRPVLDNQKLKEEFPYTPQKNSAEVFALWRDHYLAEQP